MPQNIASAASPGRKQVKLVLTTRVSIWYNSLLNVNIVPKYPGTDLFTNLYRNFIHWTSNISLTFSISSSLNNGLLFKSQYGFRKQHSTELAALELTDRSIWSDRHVWYTSNLDVSIYNQVFRIMSCQRQMSTKSPEDKWRRNIIQMETNYS